MRQGQQNNRNNRQQRGRGRRQSNSSGGGNPSNKVYDSNGPDVRVRGSAQTVADKYLQLAGDASAQGDRIKTESYFQYAEHYLRIVAANQAVKEQRQAEKEKAAEEHTARMQAKKEKTAAELERKAALAATESDNSPSGQEISESGNGSENGAENTQDDWGGHQPAFLQREEEAKPEKPKKPRRKAAKKKVVVKADDDAGKVETAPAPESEAEAPSAN